MKKLLALLLCVAMLLALTACNDNTKKKSADDEDDDEDYEDDTAVTTTVEEETVPTDAPPVEEEAVKPFEPMISEDVYAPHIENYLDFYLKGDTAAMQSQWIDEMWESYYNDEFTKEKALAWVAANPTQWTAYVWDSLGIEECTDYEYTILSVGKNPTKEGENYYYNEASTQTFYVAVSVTVQSGDTQTTLELPDFKIDVIDTESCVCLSDNQLIYQMDMAQRAAQQLQETAIEEHVKAFYKFVCDGDLSKPEAIVPMALWEAYLDGAYTIEDCAKWLKNSENRKEIGKTVVTDYDYTATRYSIWDVECEQITEWSGKSLADYQKDYADYVNIVAMYNVDYTFSAGSVQEMHEDYLVLVTDTGECFMEKWVDASLTVGRLVQAMNESA